MGKKQEPQAQPAAGEKYTLCVPVRDDADQIYSELTIADPELRHMAQIERAKCKSDSEATKLLIAALAGIPLEAAGHIKQRDAQAIKGIIDRLTDRGLVSDKAAEKAALEASGGIPEFPASEKLFKLIVPIPTDGLPITELKAVEPDIDTGIKVEGFKTSSEQTAAMIATVTGQVIPVVMRMKMADVLRIERWVDFFLSDGAAPPPMTTAETANEKAAGATSP